MVGDEDYLYHCRDMCVHVPPASAALLLVLQRSPTHTNVRRGGVYSSAPAGMNGPPLSTSLEGGRGARFTRLPSSSLCEDWRTQTACLGGRRLQPPRTKLRVPLAQSLVGPCYKVVL